MDQPFNSRFAVSRAKALMNRRRPTGFTLLEVLLTISLIVIIAAMIVPNFDKPLAAQQLRSAGEQVLVQWNQARVAAIATGRIHVFRYTPQQRKYKISPHSFDPEGGGDQTNPGGTSGSSGSGTAGGPAGTTNPGATSGSDSSTDTPPYSAEDSLPEGLSFLDPPPADSDDSTDASLPVPDDTGGDSGMSSPPIFFFPDGTASNAKVGIKNELDKAITLSLRALTGVGTIGDVHKSEEAGK